MPNILQAVLDASPLSAIKQNVRFRGTMHPEIFKLVSIEFKMTVNQPLFTSIGLISGKPCQIGRPLPGY